MKHKIRLFLITCIFILFIILLKHKNKIKNYTYTGSFGHFKYVYDINGYRYVKRVDFLTQNMDSWNISYGLSKYDHYELISDREFEPPNISEDWNFIKNMSIVYTWYNSTNITYQNIIKKYGDFEESSCVELMFSLRSLIRSLPWHTGKIFVVTPDHFPQWVKKNNKRLTFIDQNDIVPNSGNPTFNSNNIEAYFDKIPGLSETFIHFNDDYFINAAFLHPSFFITREGYIRFFWAPNGFFNYTEDISNLNQVRKAGYQTSKILDQYYITRDRYNVHHLPFVYYKSLFKKIRNKFKFNYDITLRHKFRNEKDIVTPILFQGYVIEEDNLKRLNNKKFVIAPKDEILKFTKFVKITDDIKSNEKELLKIKTGDIFIHNLNDNFKTNKAKKQLLYYLNLFYSHKTDLEL
jgi:hypothetical protein